MKGLSKRLLSFFLSFVFLIALCTPGIKAYADRVVTITVLDSVTGEPIAGAQGHITGPDSMAFTTDANGQFVYNALPSDQAYDVEVFTSETYLAERHVQFQVTETNTEPLSLTLYMTPVPTVPEEVEIRLVDKEGNLIPSSGTASVRDTSDWSEFFVDIVDGTGSFTPDPKKQYHITGPDLSPEYQNNFGVWFGPVGKSPILLVYEPAQTYPLPYTINKVDSVTGAPIEGARFALYSWQAPGATFIPGQVFEYNGMTYNYVDSYTTDANGQITTGLEYPIFSYLLVETQAAPGYQLNATPVTNLPEGSVTITNTPLSTDTVTVTVVKTDGLTLSPLPGAVFTIFVEDPNGGVYFEGTNHSVYQTVTTGSDGNAVFTGLDPSKRYFIEETEAPAGYLINFNRTVIDFSTAVDGKIEYKVSNWPPQQPYGTIQVNKNGINPVRNIVGPIEGAVFEIKDSQGVLVDTVTTDEYGQVISRRLVPGTYTVTEISVPGPYVLDSTPQEVEIPPEGSEWPMYVRFTNQLVPAVLSLTKTDADTGRLLPGAQFVLYRRVSMFYGGPTFRATAVPEPVYNYDGYVWEQVNGGEIYTTDANGNITLEVPKSYTNGWGVTVYDYIWVEVAPPAGYTMNEDPVTTTESKAGQTSDVTVTNLRNAPETMTVNGTKTWVGGPLERPQVTVNLMNGTSVVATTTVDPVTNTYEFTDIPVTVENGEVINYTVEEAPIAGYTSQVTGYDITNTYVPATTSVTVNKTWVGGNPATHTATINLMNGATEVAEYTLTPEETSYTFQNVPATDNEGNPISYSVTEDPVAGYVNQINGYEITNTYVPEKTDLTVRKTWVGGPSVKPDITVNLLANGAQVATADITGGTAEYVFQDMPVTDQNGNPITYTVSENPVAGYTTTYGTDGLSITNTYTPGTTTITVNKTWVGGPQPRPDINISLTGSNGIVYPATIASGETSSTFNVPETSQDGTPITYTVTEEPVTGYTTEITGYDITNTYTPEKADLTVTKVWSGGPAERPSITLNLLANGSEAAEQVLMNGDTGHTFTGMPVTDMNGDPITYTVSEDPVPGYTTTVEQDTLTVTNTFVPSRRDIIVRNIWLSGPLSKNAVTGRIIGSDGSVYEFAIPPTVLDQGETTNPESQVTVNVPSVDMNGDSIGYTAEYDTVPGYTTEVAADPGTQLEEVNLIHTFIEIKQDITVDKIWIGGSQTLPDGTARTATVRIEGNGTEVTHTFQPGESSYTFTGLPVMDALGNIIEYTVTEDALADYTSQMSQPVPGRYVFMNSYVSPMKQVTINKLWIGGPSVKPDVEVLLMDKDKVVGTEILKNGTTSATFTVPERDLYGNLIGYTADEYPVADYEKTVEGLNVINSYVGTREITVTKNWVGGPSVRPAIEIILYADGKEADRVILGNGEYTHTFQDLPVYSESGTEIVYTVDEVPVPGYTTAIDQSDFKITNTYTIPERKITINKNWVNGTTPRPTVHLILKGVSPLIETELPIVMEDGTTYVSVTVNETDEAGNPIVYSVTEEPVEGYTTSVDGFNVTNTAVAAPEILTVNKIWINGPSEKPEVRFLVKDSTGAVTLAEGRIPSGKTTAVFPELPLKDMEGNAISYVIEEIPVEGYTSTVDGYNITNTYKPQTGNITVTKEWVGAPSDKPDITIRLMNGLDEIRSAVIRNGETEHVFSDVQMTDEFGNPITYTVTEDHVEGYTSTIEGFNVINTYTPPATRDFTVEKIWVGGPETRPEITLRLMNGDTEVAKTVLRNGELKYTFTGLPETDPDGRTIEYHITEDAVSGYTSLVLGNKVINTFNEMDSQKPTPPTPPAPAPGLPNTGAIQNPVIPIVGAVLVLVAGIVLLLSSKKRNSLNSRR